MRRNYLIKNVNRARVKNTIHTHIHTHIPCGCMHMLAHTHMSTPTNMCTYTHKHIHAREQAIWVIFCSIRMMELGRPDALNPEVFSGY